MPKIQIFFFSLNQKNAERHCQLPVIQSHAGVIVVTSVFLTFDYELYFRESGSIEKCLLEPTDEILTILGKRGVFCTFFVDVLHLSACLKYGGQFEDHFKKITEQLNKMITLGHRVELHLHPHWIDAEPSGDAWVFRDISKYRMQSLSKDKIESVVLEGANLLNEICWAKDKKYKVQSFRAGGWCVEPFEPLKAALFKAGIRVDSSVAPGFKLMGEAHQVDFSKVTNFDPYLFSDSPSRENFNGQFIEVPISTIDLNLIDRLYMKGIRKYKKSQCTVYGDGVGIRPNTQGIQNIFKLKTFLSFESLLGKVFREKISSWEHRFLNLIAHPKSMSPASLDELSWLIDNFGAERFALLSDIHKSKSEFMRPTVY